MSTSLIINSQDSDGKNYQQSLSFVNSAMSSAALKELATMITSISTNQYVDAYVVNKNSVDEERPVAPATKQIARIALEVKQVIDSRVAYIVHYNGDGVLSLFDPEADNQRVLLIADGTEIDVSTYCMAIIFAEETYDFTAAAAYIPVGGLPR